MSGAVRLGRFPLVIGTVLWAVTACYHSGDDFSDNDDVVCDCLAVCSESSLYERGLSCSNNCRGPLIRTCPFRCDVYGTDCAPDPRGGTAGASGAASMGPDGGAGAGGVMYGPEFCGNTCTDGTFY